MLLAGDVGGTKTLMGLFRHGAERPVSTVVREFATPDFDSLDDIIQTFLEETNARDLEAACIGVAGPVNGLVARLTNVPWLADISALAERLGDRPVQLVNDLEAMAYAVPVLEPDELTVLQEGVASATGNAALIAAGTGLGEALLHNVNGRFLPSPSEGGHADFAARTPRELALVQELTRIHGRVENERVISGPGLVNLFRFTHKSQDLRTACRALGPDVDRRRPSRGHQRQRHGSALPAVHRGARHVRRGLRRRSRQPRAAVGGDRRASTSAAVSRQRYCPLSKPDGSSKRFSTRSRWWICSGCCR